jgi:cardiolipin synthase
VFTIPNVISFARLIGVLFVFYFGLISENDFLCFTVFVAAGISDWLDGYLARRLNQYSDLGALLDPIADRLYIFAALVVLLLRSLVPVWVFIVILLREVFMMMVIASARRKGFANPQVHYIGKAGTMMLLYSVPMIFLGNAQGWDVFRWFGVAFLFWGVTTYWVAGIIYAQQVRSLKTLG